jgi:hypothetical protein
LRRGGICAIRRFGDGILPRRSATGGEQKSDETKQ